jgi:hypothetical protein
MGNPLRDLGLSDITGSANNGDRMQLEHTLLISFSSPLVEKHMLKALSSISEMSRATSKAIRVIGYGLAAYFLLYGVSKVIQSTSVLTAGNSATSSNESDENIKQ